MTTKRKKSKTTVQRRGSPAASQANGHNESVDTGISFSQMTPVLLDYYYAIGIVFGGCCTNVLAYEQLLMINSRIGSALTFSQMLFITLQSLPNFLVRDTGQWLPRLKSRKVPLRAWALQVLVLTTGSLLNNWAFAYDVPLTLLIVFRSAGLAVSMLFGYAFLRKQYTVVQVMSVVLVTVGVILATLSRPTGTKVTSDPAEPHSPVDIRKYTTGISMIIASLVCTGLLGVLQEKTYRTYGPCWKEGVFYTHALSLPVFLFLGSDIEQGLSSLSRSASVSSVASYLILSGNLVTQLICVSGINKLSSQVSSVSTNLILTARKALSLCISVWWFGNGWDYQLAAGASMVFTGSVLFSTSSNKGSKED